jgi:UDP-N-acetylglucosamine/UDP-N-acetylgalactosamine 4-epimerase
MYSERYERVLDELRANPRSWLVTGAAGFIGSNLLESLVRLGQEVTGLDNFSTGHPRNLEEVRSLTGGSFRFIEGDIRDLETCAGACRDVDVVLHNAALGSVPRSIAAPLATHATNVDGTVNMLYAAREAGVKRFVYAASSSTYGDHPGLPKVEDSIGRPLSPYAVTKYVNELYASIFQRTYGLPTIGLRYFNVFGPRQDPDGAYAAVVPRWIAALLAGESCVINGDGSHSRDFCYVANVVQANLLAACAAEESTDEVFNVAVGERTTLLQLFEILRTEVAHAGADVEQGAAEFGPSRPGDIPHSHADIGKARARLGYEPTHTVAMGLREALPWYLRSLTSDAAVANASANPRAALRMG